MRLVQFHAPDGRRQVGLASTDGNHLHPLAGVATTLELATQALSDAAPLKDLIRARASDQVIDYDELLHEGRVLAPLDHPEPGRFLVTGTGLTHIGSAHARNTMHALQHDGDVAESDSLKIFRMGLEGGRPERGQIGVQPEWFFKGVGTCIVPPGGPLPLPAFALAGAEEAEIVGLYIVGSDGSPYRIGFALGNEFSDHVTEAKNYLYLAHSKLRSCSIGPELLIGDLPAEVRGVSRIRRNGEVVWQEEFLSGEAHMSHSLANLEHYHFRYPMHRRPGDLHAYFLGAAVLSCAAGFVTEPGDEFEIQASAFGKALRNHMALEGDRRCVTVTPL